MTTARLAAKKGARLMLVAHNAGSLKELVAELTAAGTEAAYAVADVGHQEQVHAAADATIARFGGFDTWNNNAGA